VCLTVYGRVVANLQARCLWKCATLLAICVAFFVGHSDACKVVACFIYKAHDSAVVPEVMPSILLALFDPSCQLVYFF
jgi:hypothetical protein